MKISGFEKIISIDRFEYLSCIDRHEVCCFSVCIKEDDIDAALGTLDSDINFENADDFKFTGHVTDVSVSNDISGLCIEVKTIGKTYLCDNEKFSRVFQQGDKTISDILSNMKSMSDVEYQYKEDPVIESIILQNNESEWNFIIHLINRYGLHLFAQEKPFIGKYGNSQTDITEENLIDYTITKRNKNSFIKCRIDAALDLGAKIKYSDERLKKKKNTDK